MPTARSSSACSTEPQRLSDVVRCVTAHGFEFREHRVAARSENVRHAHEYQCIGFILYGRGTADFARDTWMIRAGDVNLIPAGVPHRERFFTRQIGWCSIETTRLEPDVVHWAPRVFARPLQFRNGPACEIARRIAVELRVSDSAAPLALAGLALELFAAIARNGSDAREESRPTWVERLEELLRSPPAETPSIAQLAREVARHPSHLARVFRALHGCSLGEYLRLRRIERAKVLLADDDLALSSIAATSGFADQAHFTRVFKQITGSTPAAYRRSLASR